MKKILLLSGSLVFLSGCSMMNSIWTNSPNHANVSKEQNVNSNTIQSKETNASGAFYENKSGHDSWRMQY